MTPVVSVIIVAYNSGDDLTACLGDVRRQAKSLPLEAIVVDNASTDGAPQAARAAYPETTLIESRVNLGFGRGINRAFAQSSGQYVMLLNPDCRLGPEALAKLAEYLGDNPQVGIVGPRIRDFDGSVQFSARGKQGPLAFLFHRSSLLTRLWPDNPVSRRYLLSGWDHDAPAEVAWLSGAAMMLPRRVMESLKGFDERFFLFQEDVDLCRRAAEAGYRVVYWPGAEVRHRIGISQSRDSVRLLAVRHRSMMHYLRKYYAWLGPGLWLADLLIGWRFGLTVLTGLARRQG